MEPPEPPPQPETPAWFISGPSLASVGEKRAAAQRETALRTLNDIFPAASEKSLQAAITAYLSK